MSPLPPRSRSMRSIARTALLVLLLGGHSRASAAASAPAVDPAAAPAPFTAAQLEEARLLRERCLVDDTGYETLRSLTREVGPRSAGSPGDARAVEWALAKLRSLGLKNVHAEPVTVPHWIRGTCSVDVVSPWPQPLAAVALGGSIATPEAGIEAEVIPVTNLDEITQGDTTRFAGRIVFFTGRMDREHTGSGYSRAVTVRGRGAAEAGKRGALAVVIRSVGTDRNRLPHTGGLRIEADDRQIPAL